MANETLTQADAGKAVEVKAGDVISVRLEENPTTGYRWAVGELDAQVLELQSSDFVGPQGSGMGAAGERRLTFRAKQAGTTALQLQYRREWEKDNPAGRYSLTVKVEG